MGAEARPGTLLTVGHGTASAGELEALLNEAGVEALVDVRTAPGSRRHPQFAREAMSAWLAAAGIAYRWEPRLGGWRRPRPDSPNSGLRNASFRGYADHMAGPEFAAALAELAAQARARPAAVMCSESLWWRCHRRLIADAATLLCCLRVGHLDHRGRVSPHEPTAGVRVEAGVLIYGEPDGTPPPAG